MQVVIVKMVYGKEDDDDYKVMLLNILKLWAAPGLDDYFILTFDVKR